MKTNDGGSAFPLGLGSSDKSLKGSEREGMSIRDYFAAKAMQSLVGENGWGQEMNIIVKRAYEMADKMLLER